MANFATHVGTAAVLGAIGATSLMFMGTVTPTVAIGLFILTIVGTMLPDVDVDHARPVRWLFTFMALAATLLAVYITLPEPPPGWAFWRTTPRPGWQVAVAGLCAFLIVRYPLAYGFQKLTAHRGVWHSLLLGSLLSLTWVALASQGLQVSPAIAWLQGASVMIGFLIHLILDELYSVDLEGARLKRSFGTAFKLGMPGQPGVNLLLAAAIAALVWWLPSPEALINLFQHTEWARQTP